MKLQLNPLAYRTPKVFQDFEIKDLMILVFIGMFAPMFGMIVGIPVWLSGMFIWPVMMVYFVKFRSGKPKSYFNHWLRWYSRPHFWINSPSKENIYEVFPEMAESVRMNKPEKK
jgi:hypothetical protein